MIKGATTFINEHTGEKKQKCVCGAKHPLHHFACECGIGKERKSVFLKKEEAEQAMIDHYMETAREVYEEMTNV